MREEGRGSGREREMLDCLTGETDRPTQTNRQSEIGACTINP